MRVLLALAALVAAPTWAVVGLGKPPGHPGAFVQAVLVGASGSAVAIGAEGVGTDKPEQQAFVWSKGKRRVLAYPGAAFIEPTAIDAAGDVVGTADARAVLWRRGVPTALGAFTPNGISDEGAVVVGTGTVGGNPHAFMWRGGRLTDLPGLGGAETYANAVDRAGTVVGSSALPSGVDHAVVWRDGTPTDLGSVGGLDSTATLVGTDGTIVGFASAHTGGAPIALEWSGARMTVLGRFGAGGAQPAAVNARRDVLIQTETAGQGAVGLVLLQSGKAMPIAVPALGHQPLQAVGLDDRGDVVGVGTTTLRGFLWHDGVATLLPTGDQPRAVAGGWIVASQQRGGGVLLRLHG